MCSGGLKIPYDEPKVSLAGIIHQLPATLTSLKLQGSLVADEIFISLCAVTALKQLEVRLCCFDQCDMSRFSNLEGLHSLKIIRCDLPAASTTELLQALPACLELRHNELGHNNLKPELSVQGAIALGALTFLRKLELIGRVGFEFAQEVGMKLAEQISLLRDLRYISLQILWKARSLLLLSFLRL